MIDISQWQELNRRELLKSGVAGLFGTTAVAGTASASHGPTVYVGGEEGDFYALDAEDGSKRWSYTLADVKASPTVLDGTVYCATDTGTVFALDAETGAEGWLFSEPRDIYSSPTVVDGTVYIGSNDKTVYAIDARSGQKEWDFAAPGDIVRSSPTVVDGMVYVGVARRDSTLYAIDAETGSGEWEFTEPNDGLNSSPTVANGLVYIGCNDSNLYAVDAVTGDLEWKFTEPENSVRSSPTVVDGTVYVGSWDTNLYAVDAETGEQEWVFTEPDDRVYSSPTYKDGEVYIGTTDGILHALDGDTGDVLWKYGNNLIEGLGQIEASPTVHDGVVYISLFKGEVHAVDAFSGNVEWKFTEPEDTVRSSPTIVEDSRSGSSVGSRVLLGTLGHHDSWANETTALGPPFFEVSIAGTNSPVAEGETLTVDVTTENTGGEQDSQSIEVDVEGLGKETKTIALESAESTTETFSLSTGDGTVGEHEVSVTSEDDSVSQSITVESQPDDAFFDIGIRNAPRSVEAGESISVTAEIANTGDRSGTQTVEFDFASFGSDSVEVSLDGGETTTESVTVTTEEGDGGEYDVSVTSEDDSASQSITVESQSDDAFFEVAILNAPESVDAGDPIEVTVEVSNTGDRQDTQTIELSVGQLGSDSIPLGLDGRETESGSLAVSTSAGDAGSYTMTVTSNDDSAERTVEVVSTEEMEQTSTEESTQSSSETETARDGTTGEEGGENESESENDGLFGGGDGGEATGGDGDGDGAGFGVISALSSLGGTAYLLKRRLDDSED